jgi:hypothetical protein
MDHKRFSHRRLFGLAAVLVTAFASPSQSAVAQSSQVSGPTGVVSLQLASLGYSGATDPRSSSSSSSTDSLPDAPLPQGQQDQSADPAKHTNQFPLLPPRLNSLVPLTTADKLHIYVHRTFGPPAVIVPAVTSGIAMANPKSTYPKDWKDGAGAYGRNYGLQIATRTSRNTAEFMTQVVMHEDPRYLRSTSTNPLSRTAHALVLTFVDKSDSGKTRIAYSHFTGAAAGGFVGMGILPDGFNDVTHGEQRAASEFGSYAISNLLTEFQPEWGPWAQKLRIPKILPAWWVPEHKN